MSGRDRGHEEFGSSPAVVTITARVVVAIALVGFLTATAAPAHAHHSWNGYHWSSAGPPLKITYLDSLGDGFRRDHIANAVLSDWAIDDVLQLERQSADGSRGVRRSCPAATGAIRICNADYGAGWLGNTELLVEGDRVTGGRIRINDHWGTGASFRRFVLCHEVGHSLGLWHRSKGSSCLNTGRHPDGHDIVMLRKILDDLDGDNVEDDPPSQCTAGILCTVSAPAANHTHLFRHGALRPHPLAPHSYWHQKLSRF